MKTGRRRNERLWVVDGNLKKAESCCCFSPYFMGIFSATRILIWLCTSAVYLYFPVHNKFPQIPKGHLEVWWEGRSFDWSMKQQASIGLQKYAAKGLYDLRSNNNKVTLIHYAKNSVHVPDKAWLIKAYRNGNDFTSLFLSWCSGINRSLFINICIQSNKNR